MKKLIKRLCDQKGATVVEYSLIVGLISIAGLAMWLLIGPQILAVFTAVNGAFTAAGF